VDNTSYWFYLSMDGPVYSVAVQPTDNKIVIGGTFTNIYSNPNWYSRPRVARLNTNGSLDICFNDGTGPDDAVFASALQTNGRLVIGGAFTHVNSTARNRIARLYCY
jgi:hypothetical protein